MRNAAAALIEFGDYVVLDKLSDHIAYCHERARKCALQADTIDDPEARRAYLASGRRWLMLAASYEIAGRSCYDSDDAPPAIARLKSPGVPRVMCPDCGERMRLRSVTPHLEKQRAETSTFECSCGQVYQQTVGLPWARTATTAAVRFDIPLDVQFDPRHARGQLEQKRGNVLPHKALVFPGTT
jgi:predicted RNA-binding Zn-ribbon protein involved in translation (DUF1610 family)